MKALTLLFLLPALCLAAEGEIHDGYEAYYASLPGRLFSKRARVDFFIVEKNETSSVVDENAKDSEVIDDPKRRVNIRFYPESQTFSIHLGAYRFNPRQAIQFPGERIGYNSLGFETTAFLAPDWVCLEDTPSSASGTAARHQTVFLIEFPEKRRPQAWLLPSLFGSCAAIRMEHGQIRFDKVEYRYEKDRLIGVSFHEYALRGKNFVKTNRAARNASFVESGNVYKFRLDHKATE